MSLTRQKGDQGSPGLPGTKGETGLRGLPGLPGRCEPCTEIPPKQVDSLNFEHSKWEITKYGEDDYPGYTLRRIGCSMHIVNKAVAYGSEDKSVLSWMIDLDPHTEDDTLKYWTTSGNNNMLYEYDTKTSLLLNKPSKSYTLSTDIDGTANIIHSGSFFYTVLQPTPQITKFSLKHGIIETITIPKLTSDNLRPLYKSGQNYFDFSADDNDLWIIFAVPDSSNTGIAKVDPESMTIEYIWNVTLDHQKFLEMFIAYGTLYAIDNITDDQAKISIGIDLYTNTVFRTDIQGFGKFQNIAMATFDSINQVLLVWDNGKKLSYPMPCESEKISNTKYVGRLKIETIE